MPRKGLKSGKLKTTSIMLNQILAADAQGAIAANAASLSTNKLSNPTSFVQNARKLLPKAFALLVFAVSFWGCVAYAQTYDTLSVFNWGLQINSTTDFVAEGEEAILQIEVGSSNYIVEHAVEVDIELELHDDVVFPNNPTVDTDQSWFFNSSNPAPTVSTDSNARTLSVHGTASPDVGGHGTVFEITLEAGPGGIYTSHMINSGGGAMVIIDDVGYKQAAPSETETQNSFAFPNPFQEALNFQWGAELPRSVRILDQQGREVGQMSDAQIEARIWSAPKLSPGIYMVEVQYAHHSEWLKVVRQ